MIYKASMKHIGKSIKEVIEKKRITRYRIAKDLGIDEASLHRSLMDGANPEWETIKKLLDYLGYDFKLVQRKEVKGVHGKSSRKSTKKEVS